METNPTYEQAKQNFENFVNAPPQEKKQVDMYEFKNLVLSQLAYNRCITKTKICGFTRNQIINMVSHPEHYSDAILKLCNYMYLKSGYFKRLIDYFVNSACLNWNVDTEVYDAIKYYNPSSPEKENKKRFDTYSSFSAQCNKFRLENVVHDIVKRLFLNDVCFAFVVENDIDISYFFLDPKYCEIESLINGNVYQFVVDRSLINDSSFKQLPRQLQELINNSKLTSPDNRVLVPIENSLCIKYNNEFPYAFPPYFSMIADLLVLDDYKELAKAKAENDAYKLLVLKIPTKDGEIKMGNEISTPFVIGARDIVQENIGVLPVPFEVESVEFSGTTTTDKDYVEEATDNMYKNVGVSQNLLSGSSSGSELKLSILNDNGDIFRIYRYLENWVSLQMKIRGFLYKSYGYSFKILDITIYNRTEVIDEELKLAQASIPNKQRLLASIGMNPTKLLGNAYMENVVLKDIFSAFTPLASAFQQSGNGADSESNGRPEKEEVDKADSTVAGDKVDSNDKDNRI